MSAERKKLAIETKKVSGQSFAFKLNFANELQMLTNFNSAFFCILVAEHFGALIDMYLDTEGLGARATLQRFIQLRLAAK